MSRILGRHDPWTWTSSRIRRQQARDPGMWGPRGVGTPGCGSPVPDLDPPGPKANSRRPGLARRVRPASRAPSRAVWTWPGHTNAAQKRPAREDVPGEPSMSRTNTLWKGAGSSAQPGPPAAPVLLTTGRGPDDARDTTVRRPGPPPRLPPTRHAPHLLRPRLPGGLSVSAISP